MFRKPRLAFVYEGYCIDKGQPAEKQQNRGPAKRKEGYAAHRAPEKVGYQEHKKFFDLRLIKFQDCFFYGTCLERFLNLSSEWNQSIGNCYLANQPFLLGRCNFCC